MIKLITPILMLVVSSNIFAQVNAQSGEPMYSPIAGKDILVVVLSQPDSPLRVENARLLFNLRRNRVEYFWDARNIGKKPIKGYQLEEWWINGTGGTMTTILKAQLTKNKVAPEAVPIKQIIPLTTELREKLKKEAGQSRLVVFTVKDVTFSDGSRFDGSGTSNDVLKYFEKIKVCNVFN